MPHHKRKLVSFIFLAACQTIVQAWRTQCISLNAIKLHIDSTMLAVTEDSVPRFHKFWTPWLIYHQLSCPLWSSPLQFDPHHIAPRWGQPPSERRTPVPLILLAVYYTLTSTTLDLSDYCIAQTSPIQWGLGRHKNTSSCELAEFNPYSFPQLLKGQSRFLTDFLSKAQLHVILYALDEN